jgi:hypothetical protein
MTLDDDTREREAEILVLRHQLAVLKRANPRPRIHRLDRMMIAVFARLIRRDRWSGFIVSPATILRWHRELVARKWTYKRSRTGRPPLDPSLGRLIVQIAKDNPRWGVIRIKGELQGSATGSGLLPSARFSAGPASHQHQDAPAPPSRSS